MHGSYIKIDMGPVRFSVKTLLHGVGYKFSAGFAAYFEVAVESNHPHYSYVQEWPKLLPQRKRSSLEKKCVEACEQEYMNIAMKYTVFRERKKKEFITIIALLQFETTNAYSFIKVKIFGHRWSLHQVGTQLHKAVDQIFLHIRSRAQKFPA